MKESAAFVPAGQQQCLTGTGQGQVMLVSTHTQIMGAETGRLGNTQEAVKNN